MDSTSLFCKKWNLRIILFFMDMGTDILVKDSLGRNCLHIAALWAHFNLCKKPMNKHKLDVNTTTNEGWTAFFNFSKINGTYVLFKLFTDMGTDI